MPDIKEVLGLVSKKFGSDSPISKALEAENLSEVEFTDEEFVTIQKSVSSLLTPDAALNNPELIEKYKDSVHPTLKKSIYDHVETELKDLGGKFGVKFEEGEQAKDMLKKLKDFELPKVKDGDVSKYQQEIDMLNKQNAKLREEKEQEITKLKTTYSERELNNAIDSKLASYQLADVYDKDLVKRGIFENVKKELFNTSVVKVNESGSIDLYQKDMPDKLIYTEANKPLTFQDFVDPLMKDFVKKADSKEKGDKFVKEKATPTKIEKDYPSNSMLAHLSKKRDEAFGA